MESVRLNPHPYDRMLRWNALNGMRSMETIECARRNSHNKICTMKSALSNLHNRTRMIDCARWNPEDGVRTMDPHKRNHRKIESAQGNLHNVILAMEST